jgi:hypothetical protein
MDLRLTMRRTTIVAVALSAFPTPTDEPAALAAMPYIDPAPPAVPGLRPVPSVCKVHRSNALHTTRNARRVGVLHTVAPTGTRVPVRTGRGEGRQRPKSQIRAGQSALVRDAKQ